MAYAGRSPVARHAGFPGPLRPPRTVRIAAAVLGLLGIALAGRVTLTSLEWIGRVFPGFLLRNNRVVAMVGLPHWSGAAVPWIHLGQVVAVDGQPVASTGEAYAMVASRSPGSPIRYRVRRSGVEREVVVPAERFTAQDWVFFWGPELLNGVVFLAYGITIWLIRPSDRLARTCLVWMGTTGVAFLMYMDACGPSTFTRLYLSAEALAPATMLQAVLVFARTPRSVRWRFVGYVPSAIVLVLYVLFFPRPAVYVPVVLANFFYIGSVIAVSVTYVAWAAFRHPAPLARQQARVFALGGLVAGGSTGAAALYSVFRAGGSPVNAGWMTPFLFSLFAGYALLEQDILQMGAAIKRTAYYFLITAIVTAAYLVAVVLFDLVLQARMVTTSPLFPVLFTCAVLLVFDPLRRRVRALVDHAFFGAPYDGARVLADAGSALVTALTRERIGLLLRRAVHEAIPGVKTRIFLAAPEGDLRDVVDGRALSSGLGRHLRSGRVVTNLDAPTQSPDADGHDGTQAELVELDVEIAVPIAIGDELVGAVMAGRKTSGRYYTAGDAHFLTALARQAAIAFQNARSYEALVGLNAHLEERVRARTAELEDANHELAGAYGTLKEMHLQLVQAEKMAALGQLVAGVAHEINNPVSFVVGNIEPLRERLGRLRLLAERHDDPELANLAERVERAFEIIARGTERTAGIVRDLRAFSQVGDAELRPLDLHESIELTLRLLRPRWAERITIHRHYGRLPTLEASATQINQALMNVIGNACDAIPGSGHIWIRTECQGTSVSVIVRDDGVGIAVDQLPRIFDPFFTTKPQGKGTGLGLAIAQGIITGHGGTIRAASEPGRGTELSIVLPIGARGAAAGAASGGSA